MKTHADIAGQRLTGSPRATGLVSEKVAVSVVFVAAMFMSIMDRTNQVLMTYHHGCDLRRCQMR